MRLILCGLGVLLSTGLGIAACSSHGAAETDGGLPDARADSPVDVGPATDAHPGRGDAGVDAAPSADAQANAEAGRDAAPVGDSGVDPFELYDAGPPVVATTDTNGWSKLPGMPGTDGGYARAIYVDSVSGSDDNAGDTPAHALQGVGPSSKLIADLQAAPATQSIVVVLKPGSSWVGEPADQLNLPVGGTADYPLLISGSRWPGNVGTTRPRVAGMVYISHSHVAIEGLQIGPGPGGDGGGFGEGIHIAAGGQTDFLIEDNLITNFTNLIEATGSQTQPVSNLRVRRNYLFGACGSGAVVAFDGNDVAGALFEDNFFDYNGGPRGNCDYESTNLTAPYSNELAHDVYFADDGVRVVALNVTFRHNLFARTLQSIKGPYTGLMDDNLFYDYLSGGYLGTWGAEFSNNVLVNGGGFGSALDNNHSPNEIPSRKTVFCNNLHYNEGSPYTPGEYAFTSQNAAGVDLEFENNVIDGFDRAFDFNDSTCFGYDVANNIIQSKSFYEIWNPWPQALCPATFSGNRYHSPSGSTSTSNAGYGLERPGTSTQYADVAAMETFLKEDGGTYEAQPFAFTDPARNIATYLESVSLAPSSPTPTLLTYLALIRAQSGATHVWNDAIGVEAVNAYLRAGHSVPGKPLVYGNGCP